MPTSDTVSLNRLAAPLVENLVADAASLRLGVQRLDNGTRLIDAGIAAPGGIEAGRRIAEICLGGLGRVRLQPAGGHPDWPWELNVATAQPVLACLGSQYAGWSLAEGEGKGAFFALGSGPGRALAGKEELYSELGYRDTAERACLVLETAKTPPVGLLDRVARQCGVAADRLTIILTPTTSLAGGVQVVARVLEVAMHKAHFLGFPLQHIVDGMATAPVCPPTPDFLAAMGRSNDAILFGGRVHLFVRGEEAAAEDLARRLPSSASAAYGAPFADVFKAAGYDFYKIDPLLFAPAKVAVTCLDSGRTFQAGRLDPDLLERSFA
ncbi:methenyltetrahydromethanopterin cyclohydrolase [Parasulfuritortus cantonensis]|uniref:Methenyltetrahydromethanopterin cyclohydrolase n=1 Tax=Parasulfuritortus cantonensis TaxID=2528202 RepID=A0A4R1B253_9PROT|nr:methenyltetrahydromethanopterin cyclohydrolase [Parasulfuritortus cantonensis]TCJ11891.1 methenyltetrahydromethanopterin cyclohydrolase [Parasulfuritortus cantonensis]